MSDTLTHDGGCLCGAVRFQIRLSTPTFNICHCGMCRRWSAGPFLAVHSDGPARFSRDEGLTWYRSSRWAERGFCSRCGASLFWRLANRPDTLAASVEALDAPERLALDRHIYIDAKPDRYDFADARPRVTEAELMAELGLSAP